MTTVYIAAIPAAVVAQGIAARTLSPAMAALLLQQLECVGRLLERMEGPELEETANIQAAAFSASIAKLKKISADDKAELSSAIGGSRFTDASKRSLLELVEKVDGASRKRPMQHYGAWPSFGTQPLWQQVARCPEVSLELIAQHLNSLGLINPCKDTQKSIAAHVVCAETAACPFAVIVASPDEANDRFKKVGKRLKQLYKREPVEYITQLPATPALLLKMHPSIAKAVYSRECLPCECPLDPVKIAAVESLICCRGPKKKASASSPAGEVSPQASMQQMMALMLRHLSVHMKTGVEKQAAELELFLPGTFSGGHNSPAKLAALADRSRGPATPSPRPSVDSPVADRTAAVGEGAKPRCLAILDGPEHVEPPADGTAAAMRGAIVRTRASLIADRAKKAADAKALHLFVVVAVTTASFLSVWWR